MPFLTVILLCLGAALSLDPCDFSDGRPLRKDDIMGCFQTVEWDKSLIPDLYDNVEKFLKMSQYADVMLNPPSPYEYLQMDQEEEFSKLRKAAESYKYEYEAHAGLMDLYNKAHDPHFQYNPPACFRNFQYVLPYTPKLVTQSETDYYTYVILDSPFVPNIYNLYTQFVELYGEGRNFLPVETLNGYVGRRITKINGLEVIDFYKGLRDSVFHSKDIGSIINYADRLFVGTSVGNFAPYEELTLTIDLEDEGTVDILVPYMYLYPGPESSKGFGEYCRTGKYPAEYSPELRQALDQLQTTLYADTPDYSPLRDYIMKHYNIALNTEHSTPLSESSYDVERVVEDPKSLYYVDLYKHNGEVIALFVLKSFNMDWDGMTQLHRDLVKVKDRGITKLAIDLRGNGGGLRLLRQLLLRWINSDAAGVPSNQFRRRRNTISDKIHEIWEDTVVDPLTTREVSESVLLDTTEYMVMSKYLEDGSLNVYSSPYTKAYLSATGVYVVDGEEKTASGEVYDPIFHLDKTNVIALGDGTGGSATGAFLWELKALGIGRVVTVGGFRTPAETVLAGFASFAGSSVRESKDILEVIKETGSSDDCLPSEMPHNVGVRVTWDSMMSRDDVSKFQEYREPTGDYNIMYHSSSIGSSFPNFNADYPYLMDELINIWETHPFEHDAMQTQSTCEKSSDDHGVYGNAWNEKTGRYNGECTFLYCKHPYFYDYDTDTCQTYFSVHTESGVDVALLVPLIIFAITTVVFVVLFVLFFLRSRRQGSKLPNGELNVAGV